MKPAIVPMIEPVEKMLQRIDVSAIFGEPTRKGDITIIPVAETSFGFGFGYGSGQPAPEAGGGGIGAGGSVRPRGYIHITPDSVTFKPIIDQTRIVLASFLMTAWIVFWITKTIRDFVRPPRAPEITSS